MTDDVRPVPGPTPQDSPGGPPAGPRPGAEELLVRMIAEVFNEPSPQQRAAVIPEVFTADVVFSDAERTVTGHDALAATVTGLLAQGPGLLFTPSGAYRGVADLGMRSWRLGPPGGEPVLTGLDVVQVVDGRISRLWTVLGD